MRIPYGYILNAGQLTINEKAADTVCKIFNYYLAGASLGKIVDTLFDSGIPSPTGNPKWTRAAIDKLLSDAKYIPLVGFELYSDVQFEKERRYNIDYDRAGHPRKTTRFHSTIELYKVSSSNTMLFKEAICVTGPSVLGYRAVQ